jgi:hypothetical protein
LRYGNAAGFVELLGKESIRFFRAFRGRKVIAALKINGISLSTGTNSRNSIALLHVIAFGKLKTANEVGAFLYDLAHWAHHLISHPRAAFFVQQVHVNAMILDRGMDTTGMETRPKERTPLPRASQSNPVSLDTWMQAKPKCAEHHQEIRNEYHR